MMSYNSSKVNNDPQFDVTRNSDTHLPGTSEHNSAISSYPQSVLPHDIQLSAEDGEEVSKQNPCPCCTKTDWCFLFNQGNAVVCGRTEIPKEGWREVGTAKDGRSIFARIDSSYNRQSRQTSLYKVGKRHIKLPEHNTIQLLLQEKSDFPEWVNLGQHINGEVEQQIVYRYPETETGNPRGQVVRKQWTDRRAVYGDNKDKEIRPWHWIEPHPTETGDGKWSNGKGKKPWPLYREAEARDAIALDVPVVFYGAGEQAVESFRRLGLTAFCNQGGEGTGINQIVEFLKAHAPKLFVIWADYDQQGETTKDKLLKQCSIANIAVVAIDPLQIWANLPSKGDITDVLEKSGLTHQEIIRRLEVEIHRALAQRQQDLTAQEQEGQKPPQSATIARELAERYQGQLTYNGAASSFLHYEAKFPGVWSELSDIQVQSMIQAELDTQPLTAGKYGIGYVNSIIQLLKGYLQVKEWQEPPDLLPFRNGILALKTSNFLPHAPGYRFTWALSRDYTVDANGWNTISNWLDEVMGGNTDLIFILLCWLNACLKGRSDLQRFLHLVGPGGTGKGTFMRLCLALIGEINAHSSTLAEWCGNRFETANAYRKRLVLFWDEDKYRSGLSRFKSLTGEDYLRGEFKNIKHSFHFVYRGMVMLSSNFSIFTGDNSSGMSRRALIIPFNIPVDFAKRRDLESEFRSELPALTHYVLAIPDNIVTKTLLQTANQSTAVLEQSWENRIRIDSIASWLNDYVIYDQSAKTQVGNDKENRSTLFGSYWQYCEQTGSQKKNNREFTPDLLDLCHRSLGLNVVKKATNQGKFIVGLRLRTPSDEHIPSWLHQLSVFCDGCSEGDGAMTNEGGGSEPSPFIESDGCDGLVSLVQLENIEQIDTFSLQTKQPAVHTDSSVTSVRLQQSEGLSSEAMPLVISNSSVTSDSLHPIQVGSRVRKRNKHGWNGIVLDIQGERASVQWTLEKYPDQLMLADLEALE